jgi:2-polyprenyl-3-methyl-5-hydroxy-6-metoxy-1,4-benzoquinol methylase
LSLPADFDVVLGGVPRFAAESRWAWRLARRYLRALPARGCVELFGTRPAVSDARAAGESAFVLVQADPEAYLPPVAAERLLLAVAAGGDGVVASVPVTNEPWSEETRSAPPFAYHTPTLLDEAVSSVALSGGPRRAASAEVASPVFAVRRGALASLPPDLPLDEAVRALAATPGRVVIEPAAYVHRYGAMDGQAREDLAARIPAGASAVLDVGCSHGATAPALRRAGVARIVGIEPDLGDAAEAAKAYDQVLPVALEAIAGEAERQLVGQFDAILFGDVLEHLENPAAALVRVRPWLSERGAVVASVPNVGHWSVIADLVAGRFDYVPYSILSGTHVRFFTRRTLVDLFEACGYGVRSIETVRFDPSPEGARRLAALRAIPGASADLDAVEFIATAAAVSQSD